MERRWALALLPLWLACKPSGEEDLRKGNVFFAHQEWARAEAHYRAALEAAPNSTTALEALGNIAYEQGQPKKAIEWYEKALAVDEAAISARHKLAVALLSMEDATRAMAVLTRTTELAPQDPFAYQLLGNLLQKQGNLQKAEAMERRALEVDPEYHAARAALANLLIDDGRLDEAERELERLLRRQQEALATWGQVRLAAKRGALPEVGTKLERLLTLGASHPERILLDPLVARALEDPSLSALKAKVLAAGAKAATSSAAKTRTSTEAGR